MNIKLLSITALSFTLCANKSNAQAIFSGEPVQIVGSFNGYATTPYNSDYRTTSYRKITTNNTNPTDGRGQWVGKINVQNSGGDATPTNMSGGGGNGFLFISGPSSNRFQNKWVFGGVMQGNLNAVNTLSDYNSGQDIGLNMSTVGFYSFVLNDVGYTNTNSKFYVGYTSAMPVDITHNNNTVNGNGTASIFINTSAAISPEEKIYVRYTLGGDFASTGTSFMVQATGAGTSYMATIPAQPSGTSVIYYVFSSTETLAQLNANTELERSLAVLKLDDNNKVNYTYNASVLPLQLTSFTGYNKGNNVQLYWITTDELNMSEFEILRSVDGNNFAPIGIKKANNIASNYEFVDATPLASTSFYKLGIKEIDGKISFSKIVTIVGNTKLNSLNVYPNPAINFVNVVIPALQKGLYKLTIFNLTGQAITELNYTATGIESKVFISLSNLSAKGKYIIQLIGNNKKYNGEFMVE
jgi:Secretion system C-terminal sorting domain